MAVGVDQQGIGTPVFISTSSRARGAITRTFSRQTASAGPFSLLQTANGLPTPDSQWTLAGIANFAVNPVNSSDVVISSDTGNIFATSNGGVTWFDIGEPSIFGSPGNSSIAMAYGAPDPNAPEGIGNEGNFIYVGTSSGQIYVTQDGGGSGRATTGSIFPRGWMVRKSNRLTQIPLRGSHEAYAVTQKGVYFMADSIPSASNPTPTWVNITGNIFNLAYYDLRSELQPDDRP